MNPHRVNDEKNIGELVTMKNPHGTDWLTVPMDAGTMETLKRLSERWKCTRLGTIDLGIKRMLANEVEWTAFRACVEERDRNPSNTASYLLHLRPDETLVRNITTIATRIGVMNVRDVIDDLMSFWGELNPA